MFVATWNVGGKTPNNRLNLQDFLQIEESPDIYVLGYGHFSHLEVFDVILFEFLF